MTQNKKHWYTRDTQSFDPEKYPKTYRDSTGLRVFQAIIGMIFTALGLLATIIFVGKIGVRDLTATALMVGLFVFITAFGIYATLGAFRSKTILLADSIEMYGIFGMRRLRKDQIAGWRVLPGQRGASALALEPAGHGKRMKIPRAVQRDSAFAAWIESLPNLDAVELQQAEAAIAADESLGATSEERLARLAHARRIAKWFAWPAYASLIVAVFHPQSNAMLVFCALAAMPWLAVLLQVSSPKLYSLQDRKSQAKAGLANPFLLPGLSLALWAMTGTHLVNWHPAMGLAVAAAILMGGLALIVDPTLRQRKTTAITWVLLMGAYGYGAGIIGDVVTDVSMPQTFHVAVLGKHVVHGKHTSWDVRLAPWGPIEKEGDVGVSSSFYEQVDRGDTICTNLRHGSIGIEWYTVAKCG